MALEIVASAVLQTVLQQSAEFLVKEALNASSVSDQFRKMQDMQRLISRFVDEVRKLENKTEDVKEALKQLWEVTYEAHDVLTDCIIRFEYRKDASCSSFLLRSLYDPFLHQAGKKLEKINSKLKEKQETLRGFVDRNISTSQANSTQNWRALQSQDMNPDQIVGLESDLETIKEWMFTTTNEVNCIAIVGMGGLGKTTIAQKIFHDDKVREHFGGLAWVTVSRSFDAEKISKQILDKLDVRVTGIKSDELMGKLKEELKDKNCLVVLDDVWQITNYEGWWVDFCSYFSKSSCIIITTRDLKLAGKMGVKDSQIHKPNTLNDEDSRFLFSKMAFPSSNGECPDKFKDMRCKILEKCGGLPLAIKIIGSLLKNKSPPEWKEVLESFHRYSKTEDIDHVKNTLRLSFSDLPGRLQHCLLCLSVYPEDYKINAASIIHWWIAEGLVEIKEHDSSHDDDLESSVMKMGYYYLSGLISRCLIEVVERRYDGTVTIFKIHDMVREMIISIAEEEGFCSFNDRGLHIWKANSYWLGFMDEMDEKLLRKNSNKLRVLTLMASRPVDFDNNSGLLLSLRVLDFSGIGNYLSAKQVKNLFEWIGSLRRLACLNLSGAEAVRELPSTIGKLLNLQLLILRGCTKLVKIHASITCLKRLIVLDLVGCPLQYFPRGLERLSCLQELTGFKVKIGQAKSRCCRLRELKSLTQLRVLRIVISTTDEATTLSESEPGILLTLHKLKVLAIDTGLKEQEHVKEMVDSLGVPPKLQELYLNGYCFELMPEWFDPKKLSSLQYLCIENSDIVHLSNQVESNSCQSGWNVRGLSLKGLSKLQVDWKNLIKVMPELECMDVSLCSNKTLKNFPCSVEEAGFWKKKQG